MVDPVALSKRRPRHARLIFWDKSGTMIQEDKMSFGFLPLAVIGGVRAASLATVSGDPARKAAIRHMLADRGYAHVHTIAIVSCPPRDSTVEYVATMGHRRSDGGTFIRRARAAPAFAELVADLEAVVASG